MEVLQRFLVENDIKSISPVITSFNEVERMSIPLIQYCAIHKATRCFKYLLINQIEDPRKTMQELSPIPDDESWETEENFNTYYDIITQQWVVKKNMNGIVWQQQYTMQTLK